MRLAPSLLRALTTASLALAFTAPCTIAAQSNVATDPDVLGAERLFSAWMEGQIAYRGLPGIAVGVVYDQSSCGRPALALRISRTRSG